jgi:hypothetical protein
MDAGWMTGWNDELSLKFLKPQPDSHPLEKLKAGTRLD